MNVIRCETARARQAYGDYATLGPGRSLEALARLYQSRTEAVPTRQLSRLKAWSHAHGWQRRLVEAEAAEEAERRQREFEARRAIMGSGFAVDFERVRVLDLVARRAYEAFMQLNLSTASPRKIEVFGALFRGALDDIAKETGGRVQHVDVRTEIVTEAKRMAEEYGLNAEDLIRDAEAWLKEHGN